MIYRGLCIGGPLDGEYAECERNMLRIPQDGEIVTLADGSRAPYQPNLSFNYVYVARYWWPYDARSGIPGLTTILDRIDRSYAEARMKNVD